MPYRRKSTKTTKKRYTRSRVVSARQVATIAKRVLKKNAESKQHLNADGSPTATSLYHNQSHCMFGGSDGANLLGTSHGVFDDSSTYTAGGNRIGDEIWPTGLRINFIFQVPIDRQTVYVRFILLKGHDSYLGAAVPWHANALAFDNVMLNMVDTDKVKVMMNKVWKLGHDAKTALINPPQTASNNSHNLVCSPRKIYCDLRKLGKYTYRHDGTNFSHGKHFDIKAYLCAYDEFGDLITDNVIDYTAQSIFYFRDNC